MIEKLHQIVRRSVDADALNTRVKAIESSLIGCRVDLTNDN